MGRLIDADLLIEKLKRASIFEKITNAEDKNVFEIIEDIPTAYDVEKVVAELAKEELDNSSAQAEAQSGMCGNMANYYCGNKDAYGKAIEIVRKGGVE